MNVSDMHLAFKIGIDKIDSLNNPNFTPKEIDFLLNQAQERFIKQRYGINNNTRKSFESDQKRTDDLRGVVKNSVLQFEPYDVNENIDKEARFVNTPSDYWFSVNERCIASYKDCNDISSLNNPILVRQINHDELSVILSSPFDGPSKDKVLRLMIGNKFEIIKHKDVSLVSYNIRYIKKPNQINLQNSVDCELADHTHSEIVNEAIMIGLEAIESPRSQGFIAIQKNNQE